jgi:hypothetical protein
MGESPIGLSIPYRINFERRRKRTWEGRGLDR